MPAIGGFHIKAQHLIGFYKWSSGDTACGYARINFSGGVHEEWAPSRTVMFLFGEQVKAFDMQTDAPFGNHKHVAVMNTVVGVICLGFLLDRLGRITMRLIRCHGLHKRW